EVGVLHRLIHVDVDCRDLCTTFLARVHGVRHDIDLRVHRVGAPDHNQIGFRHFARVNAGYASYPGCKAGVGEIDADRRMKAGILLRVTQAIDAVTHHQTHRPGVVVRPDTFGAVASLGLKEFFSPKIKPVIPGYALELAGAS